MKGYLLTNIIQCLLSLLFLWTGATKIFLKGEMLLKYVPISKDVPEKLLRKIGGLEMLVSFGLIIPFYLGIFPILTLFADAGIIFLMIGAMVYHFSRKQWLMLTTNIIVIGMACFVLYEMIFTGKE
jgi:hypothetical protein